MTEPTNYTQFNSAWLTQNINTNATAGIQLSEARAALATNEAAKAVLANFDNAPAGQDPTIDSEQLTKSLIDASINQPIYIKTPEGLVAVFEGSVIPDIAPQDAPPARGLSPSIVTPVTEEKAKASAPSDEPAAKGALATIKDVSKAFRKDTPEEIRQKATEGKLTVEQAKMWATTTTREGRALLGISGRMDEADRAILVKQHLSRKAEAKADAPAGADAPGTPKKGLFSKAVDTVTWPFRKAWEGIKKGVNWITGKKEAPAEPPQKAEAEVAGSVEPEPQPEATPEPEPAPKIEEKRLEPPAKGETEHAISAGDTYSKIARQNLVDNGVASPTETLISKRARQILDANPGTDPINLQIGSKINLPSYDPAELEKAPELIPENSSATSTSKESSDESEETAKKELKDLGYLDDTGKITPEGKKVAKREDLLNFLTEKKVSDPDSAYTELRTASLTSDLEELAAAPDKK